MVLQLLRQEQKPDIVFVYVGNDKGERDLSKVQPLARHYGFQEVDPRKYLQTLIDAGKVRWEDIARDGIHPNEKGHAIYAEAVIQLLKQQAAVEGKPPTPVPPVPPPYSSDEWATATLVPVAAAHFGKEWKAVKPAPWDARFWDEMIESDQVGATLTFTAHSTTLGVYLLIANDCGNIDLVDRRRKRDRVDAGKLGDGQGRQVGKQRHLRQRPARRRAHAQDHRQVQVGEGHRQLRPHRRLSAWRILSLPPSERSLRDLPIPPRLGRRAGPRSRSGIRAGRRRSGTPSGRPMGS